MDDLDVWLVIGVVWGITVLCAAVFLWRCL